MYYGDIRLGDTVDLKFTTRQFSTGAPFTLAGSPVISAYVGNGTTEITSGITLTVDFDGRTGLNNVRVVASGGNGFAAATNVQLVITTGTVDGVSVVGEVIGSFSIEARSALMPTTAARTLDVSAGGEAGIDWANVGSPTTSVGLSGTTVKAVTDGVAVTTNNDKTGYRLSATGVDDVWDEVVDGALTGRESLRINNAAQGGMLSGAATATVTIRNPADTKNRIVATVDSNGNRSAVTLDVT